MCTILQFNQVKAATAPSDRERETFIKLCLPIVDKQVEKFTHRIYSIDARTREEWTQEARTSLIRTVDLSEPDEPKVSLKKRIRRNARSRLVELSAAWIADQPPLVPLVERLYENGSDEKQKDGADRPLLKAGRALRKALPRDIRARSLNPRADSQYYIEEIGEVQLLMPEQCRKHFPRGILRRLMPEFKPENRARFLDLAKVNMSSDWLSDLRNMGLAKRHIEPLMLVYGLDMEQCDVARVLGRSAPGVCKLVGNARYKMLAAGHKKIFKTGLINSE